MLARFPDGGGGLLTYVKVKPAGETVYVHTFNTESGFARKMEALRIPWELAFEDGRGTALVDMDRAAFRILVTVLEHLDDPRKTKIATVVREVLQHRLHETAIEEEEGP